MSRTPALPVSPATPLGSPRLLPLQPGDHLTAEEFERRYDAMPDLKKAELIDGVVYIPPPVSFEDHASPHSQIATWVGTYAAFTFGVRAGDNGTVRLNPKSRPQPDLMLLIRPGCGGATTLTGGYVTGPPELVVEIAASSASYDLHSKLREYHRAGVREYVVWRVWDRAIDWFLRNDPGYDKIQPDNGILHSQVFPGLWLDSDAMLAGDLARVLAVLQQGIASPEHAAFCARLRQTAGS
jgi:Uma2 family endonuclease